MSLIRSALASTVLLRSRAYLLGGIGAAVALASLVIWMNADEAGTASEEQGPMGTTLTIAELNASDGLAGLLANTTTMLGIVILAVCATAVASDFSSGAIRNLLVRQPRRSSWFIGKFIALLGYVATSVAAVVVAGTAVAVLTAPAGVDTSVWFTSDGLAALAAGSAKLFLATAGWGAFGLVLALGTRSAVVSLAAGVTVAIPLDMVVHESVSGSAQWLPGQLFQSIAQGGGDDVSFARSLITVIGGVAVTSAAVLGRLHRSDITE